MEQTLDTPTEIGRTVRVREMTLGYRAGKRIVDLALSIFALIALAPMLVLVAILIKVESRGPVFFRQHRVGENGKEFSVFKFRSMAHGADQSVHKELFRRYAQGESILDDEHGPRFKADDQDMRVTKIGRFIRATDIDELPQLINVVRGQMSLVGPRPAIPYELEYYKPEHHLRYSVTPGVTGLWQVSDRFRIDMESMMALDLDYVERRSLGLDVWLIFYTIYVLAKAMALKVIRKLARR